VFYQVVVALSEIQNDSSICLNHYSFSNTGFYFLSLQNSSCSLQLERAAQSILPYSFLGSTSPQMAKVELTIFFVTQALDQLFNDASAD